MALRISGDGSLNLSDVTLDNVTASGLSASGNVVLPSTTEIGAVSSTELGYVDGVTSALQTQLNTLDSGLASKLDLAGDTMTGTLNINPSTGNATARITSEDNNAVMEMQSATGEDARITFETGSSLRWLIRKDNVPESGSNAGSDFRIAAYDDSGSNIDDVVIIFRDTLETRMQGVYENTTATAGNVNVDSAGRLRRSTSSIKYKTDVETLEDDYADKVLDLRPVWYRSTVPSDNPEWSHYGLIAEEVAEVDPRLVQFAKQEDGTLEPEGVQYDRLVPHLINIVQRQQAQIDALTARLDAAGL